MYLSTPRRFIGKVQPRILSAVVAAALLFVAGSADSQVLITEVGVDTESLPDVEEWMELQNVSSASVSIGGWRLTDYDFFVEAEYAIEFPPDTILSPGQTIVVARLGALFRDRFGRAPDFEYFNVYNADHTIPDMRYVEGVGDSVFLLDNSEFGDAVMLRDSEGILVDGVEWGAVDRLVPGAPLPITPVPGVSFARVGRTGGSAIAFAPQPIPTPGIGFTATDTPSLLTLVASAPDAQYGFEQSLTVTATAHSDIDGIRAHFAVANARTGPAQAPYRSVAMTPTGDGAFSYAGRPEAPGNEPLLDRAPDGFHERYLRFFFTVVDAAGNERADPIATSDADTPYFHWRNIVPPGTSAISDATEADAQGRLRYLQHFVRIGGTITSGPRPFFAEDRATFVGVQDESGAIQLRFPLGIPVPDIGQRVELMGAINQRFGLAYIELLQDSVSALGEGAAIAPLEITISEALARNTELQGRLVKIKNARPLIPRSRWGRSDAVISDGTGFLTLTPSKEMLRETQPQAFHVQGVLATIKRFDALSHLIVPSRISDIEAVDIPDNDGEAPDPGCSCETSSPSKPRSATAPVAMLLSLIGLVLYRRRRSF